MSYVVVLQDTKGILFENISLDTCLQFAINLVHATRKYVGVHLQKKDLIIIYGPNYITGFKMLNPYTDPDYEALVGKPYNFAELAKELGYVGSTLYEVDHGYFKGDYYTCLNVARELVKKEQRTICVAKFTNKRVKAVCVVCDYYGTRFLYSEDIKFKKARKRYVQRYLPENVAIAPPKRHDDEVK